MLKLAEMSCSAVLADVIKVSTVDMNGVESLFIAPLNSCGPRDVPEGKKAVKTVIYPP